MNRIRVFISSVQGEFAAERQILFDYLQSDPLLGRFFVPFIFERVPASGKSAANLYLQEVEHSDIYLGIFGKEYGFEDAEGISPTEREFDHATIHHKTRLVFISSHKAAERHPKEVALIKKAEQSIVRKRFASASELKSSLYASLAVFVKIVVAFFNIFSFLS